MAQKTYSGSCHCGAVKFEADLDLAGGTIRCNCSICTKARSWFTFAKGPGAFRLLAGESSLADYQWTPPGRPAPHLHFRFCKTCGIRTFAQGDVEALGGIFHAVPLVTLDGVDPDELAAAPVRYVDGRANDYDRAPADIRTM